MGLGSTGPGYLMNCVRERRRRAIKFLYLKHDYLKFAGRFCIAPRKYKLHFGGCKNNWRIRRMWSFVYPVLIILIIHESGELLFHLLVKNHYSHYVFQQFPERRFLYHIYHNRNTSTRIKSGLQFGNISLYGISAEYFHYFTRLFSASVNDR